MQVIERLRRERAAAEAEVAELRLENDALRREVEELKRRLGESLEQIEELDRAAHRQAAPFRRRKELKIPDDQKKRPGRKAGHPGAYRPRPPHIDHFVEVPLPDCPHCHGPVENRTPITQYIEELPVIRPEVTRLTTWKGVCKKCGEVHNSHPLQQSLAQGAAKVQLGPRATAFAALLHNCFGVTKRKTCAILKQGFGLSFSAGGLSQLLHRVANKLKPSYDALLEALRGADANYVDQTSWYVMGPGYALWVVTNPDQTVFHVDESYGGGVALRLLGPDYQGVVASDCHGAFMTLPFRQHKCIAHHLQALKKHRKLNPQTASTAYLDEWERLWKDVIELRKARDDLPDEVFVERRAALEGRWETLLARPVKHAGDKRFRNRMVNYAGEHRFGCLYYDVEATNNRAERALRPAVIARKLSCGNRTPRGARTWEIIVSVATTLAQRGQDVLDELTSALTPAPAPTAG
jgi:transposase